MIARRSRTRAAAHVASLAFVAATAWAQDGPADGPPHGDRPRKGVCRVELEPKSGIPSSCVLVAFEEGAFVVRRHDGSEYRVPESELKAVRFYPLQKPFEQPGPPKVPGDAPGGERPDDDPAAHERKVDEWLKRHAPRLEKLRRDGKLAGHIAELENRLRETTDIVAARQLLFEIGIARRVAGDPPDAEYYRRLIRTIRDAKMQRALGGWRQGGGPPPWRPRR